MDALRNTLRAVISEPFIAATGLAAFVHSTWSLAVLFSGRIPSMDAEPTAFWLAVGPAMLLAFSIDVGQIITSNSIRNGKRNAGKIATFAALALATYYLQWIYMAHHVPALALGEGIRSAWVPGVTFMRDASVFIVPLLLPLATVLYTISNESLNVAHAPRVALPQVRNFVPTQAQNGTQQAAQPQAHTGKVSGTLTGELASCVTENADETWTATCEHCDRAFTKGSEASARNALTAHLRTHKRKAEVHSNGHNAPALQAQAQ